VVFAPGGAARAADAARLTFKPELALVYTLDGAACRLPLAPGGSN
jgi:hypothetical protein